MSEYDDICNEVVGDLAVVIYHREQEIDKLKQDNQDIIDTIIVLRQEVWLEDIESPCCPEYIEHHESIQRILKFIDNNLLKEDDKDE